jgi:hypothetical protein
MDAVEAMHSKFGLHDIPSAELATGAAVKESKRGSKNKISQPSIKRNMGNEAPSLQVLVFT